MAIGPVSLSVPSPGSAAYSPKEASGGSPAQDSFPGVFNQLLHSAAHSHESAEAAVRDMALGRTDNLHGVMLQMAQADLTFHLILEIRNRLTDAYQEIMKMPM
jgi:flagellar hook-basal body complex protein FliE